MIEKSLLLDIQNMVRAIDNARYQHLVNEPMEPMPNYITVPMSREQEALHKILTPDVVERLVFEVLFLREDHDIQNLKSTGWFEIAGRGTIAVCDCQRMPVVGEPVVIDSMPYRVKGVDTSSHHQLRSVGILVQGHRRTS